MSFFKYYISISFYLCIKKLLINWIGDPILICFTKYVVTVCTPRFDIMYEAVSKINLPLLRKINRRMRKFEEKIMCIQSCPVELVKPLPSTRVTSSSRSVSNLENTVDDRKPSI